MCTDVLKAILFWKKMTEAEMTVVLLWCFFRCFSIIFPHISW